MYFERNFAKKSKDICVHLDLDRCAGRICMNGGHCDVEHGKTVCRCPARYTGEFCEFGEQNKNNK